MKRKKAPHEPLFEQLDPKPYRSPLGTLKHKGVQVNPISVGPRILLNGVERLAVESLLQFTKTEEKDRTQDTPLRKWIETICRDKDFRFDFQNHHGYHWQVKPNLTKKKQRIDAALFNLACHVIWFRWSNRFDDADLALAYHKFHNEMREAARMQEARMRAYMFGWGKKYHGDRFRKKR